MQPFEYQRMTVTGHSSLFGGEAMVTLINRKHRICVAIWDDGRVVFAKNPEKWGHELLHGRIAPYRVERLKKALVETGMFDLKGFCYLGPDMPTDCVMVDLGDKQQMLYWVEGQIAWMEGKPHRMDFVRSWKMVNALAAVACPDQFESVSDQFENVPESWYLKRAIQSE